MANKKTTYHYVLVFTDCGPMYVTSIDFSNKTAKWNRLESPLNISKEMAKDLALGLSWGGNSSVVVDSNWEIESQPYCYQYGKLTWVEKENLDE